MSTKKRNRTALDDHVEHKAAEMGVSERYLRNVIKTQHPEVYADLIARPSSVKSGLAQRLQAYVDAQGPGSVALRKVEMPAAPWPAFDNPAIEGLISEALARFDASDDIGEVIAWAVVHGFYEGRIAAATGEPTAR